MTVNDSALEELVPYQSPQHLPYVEMPREVESWAAQWEGFNMF